jgi:SRSO17 transposase
VGIGKRLTAMISDFSPHFVVRGKDVTQHAADYLSGLLGTERRKNVECIHRDIPQSNYQGMQQLLTNSPWEEKKLMEQVAGEVNDILGGHPQSALLIDETSFVKKGNASVGVQRQYCGRLGKKENCQVGVFACLGRGDKAAVVDFRLFLPEAWVQDAARCDQAKIPEAERRHCSKLTLALEMVASAQARGVEFDWVLADSAYGCSLEFCAAVAQAGLKFMCDVSASNCVWDADPQPCAPAQVGAGRGRPAVASVVGNKRAKKWRVRELVGDCFEREARELVIRQTTKGELRARVWVKEVWVWEKGSEQAKRRTLVAREMEDGEMKISWTNAPAETAWEALAYMQAQRHWVERAFEDGKSELGMAQYEVRQWRGWHHHMALVSLAMLFVLKERVSHADSAPLLSARDVVELLEYYLPRRGAKEEEVLADLVARHQQRIAAAKSHAKSQRKAAAKT